jgi:hypothetical protein
MISEARRFIFLHVQRTGGNTIQDYLLPFSDDRKTTPGNRDGRDTFEITGPITPTKHAKLPDYAASVPLAEYRIVMSVRHPVERALSLYFAPIRAQSGQRKAGAKFNFTEFEKLLGRMPRMVDYLTVDGTVHMPQLLLRYEDGVAANLARLCAFLNLPRPEQIEHLNAGERQQRDSLATDPRVAGLVRDRFAADFKIFAY